MRSTFRRVLAGGPGRRIYRGSNWIIRNRVHLLVTALILSMLVASLPVTGRTQGPSRSAQSASVQGSFYDSMTRTLTAIGGWLTSYVNPKPLRNSYQPVTAYTSPPLFINSPTDLTVTATSSNTIDLSWTAPTGGADHYEVERSNSISGPFLFIGSATGTTYHDTVTTLHAYLYRVRAVTAGGVPSTPSNMAFGTAIAFEFSSLSGKDIKAQHLHDVRTATNAVRALTANLSQLDWAPRTNLTGLDVKGTDVQQIRDALDAALGELGVPVTGYQDSTLTPGTTLIQAVHFEQLQTRSTRGKSTSTGPTDPDSSNARLDPMNETGGGGENPLSRNFNWNLPLVTLPGRAGLDLNLTLSYNSLVWTKISPSGISFDDDNGFPGPGFRLGFPVIQFPYYNAAVGKEAYLLIGSDGHRTELRRVGSSALYEAGDSSHLLLDKNTMILRTASGTQMTYEVQGGEYKCTKIKDRNGNYISVTYDQGRLNTLTDTLGRVITFNYIDGWLESIRQQWLASPAPPHFWARFEYTNKPIHVNFPGKTLYGVQEGDSIKTLTKVKLPDDSHVDFSYTSWGQVFQISTFAPDNNHLLNYRRYNLPETAAGAALEHDDCPRFTERRDWAQYWNGDTEGTAVSSEEALTQFAVPADADWTMPGASTTVSGMRAQVTAPDGTSNKFYFLDEFGWQRGLPALVDTYASGGSQPVRRVMTTWTQDSPSGSYLLNPRVLELNTYDDASNRARTEFVYEESQFSNGTSCQLLKDVIEYAANASTKLRTTRKIYHPSTDYSNLHILGLVTELLVYEGAVNPLTLKSRVGFFYDNENESTSINGNDEPVQHDNANFSSNFITGRANLSSVKRYDVTSSAFTLTRTRYNTAGAVVSTADASGHETAISYADSFSDGDTSRNTFAYPTTVTTPGNFITTTRYNFNFGAITSIQTPEPNSTTYTAGPEQTYTFDTLGRLQKVTSANGAYTRWSYTAASNRVDTYETIQDELGEANSFTISDGQGRVVATASQHPGSDGGYSGQKTVYDVMGRVIKTSNPTETSASGTPSEWNTDGDDETTGWIYTEQTYDWKGRPLVLTHPSTTGNPANTTSKVFSYSGCGCAGGEVVTLTDEGTLFGTTPKKRQQKRYSDVLGRLVKTEILNWDGQGSFGTGGTVYSATVNAYDVLDHITSTTQYAGAEGSGTSQVTSMTYDGFGRLHTRHQPEQGIGANTAYGYNSDDTIQTITDGRGATTTFVYNGRHLPTSITHALSGSATILKTYTYDAVGNRKSMSQKMDGVEQDRASYTYDQLSRLTSETKHINALESNPTTAGDYQIGYSYTLSGQLASVTDPFGEPINFNYDVVGRTSSITGTYAGNNFTFANNFGYRAWGAIKSISYGDTSSETVSYNNRLQPTQYRSLYGSNNWRRYDYSYYDDGSLKQLTDLDDIGGQPAQVTFHYMSRQYFYDNALRVSGVGAIPNNWALPAPFSGSYSYDAFNNLNSRSGVYGINQSQSDTATYTNNRRSGWTYDADGRVTASADNSDTSGSSTRTWTYNAAGEKVTVAETAAGSTKTNTLAYNGDGKLLYDSVVGAGISTSTYIVCSTVLETALTRLNATGNKITTSLAVPGFAKLTHTKDQNNNPVVGWNHGEPSGLQENGLAYDPFGNLISNVQPPISGPPPYVPFYGGTWGGTSWSNFNKANNLSSGCYSAQNSNPQPCSNVLQNLNETFFGNLPGAHDDMWWGEQVYAGHVGEAFGALGWPTSNESYWGERGGNGARFPTQQQTLPDKNYNKDEIKAYMDEILQFLKDNPDCESGINKILSELKNLSGFDGGNIRSIIDNFKKNGVLRMGQTPNGGGSAGTGYGGIPAISVSPSGNYPDAQTNRIHTMLTTIGEMIHWAGMAGNLGPEYPNESFLPDGSGFTNYFPDMAMATAANNLGYAMTVEQYRRTYPDVVKRDRERFNGSDFAASTLAHYGGINNACLKFRNGLAPENAKP